VGAPEEGCIFTSSNRRPPAKQIRVCGNDVYRRGVGSGRLKITLPLSFSTTHSFLAHRSRRLQTFVERLLVLLSPVS
jgi:hypothetical protein